jgi:hypothetical protein
LIFVFVVIHEEVLGFGFDLGVGFGFGNLFSYWCLVVSLGEVVFSWT